MDYATVLIHEKRRCPTLTFILICLGIQVLPSVFASLFLSIELLNYSSRRFVLHIEWCYFKQRCHSSRQRYWKINQNSYYLGWNVVFSCIVWGSILYTISWILITLLEKFVSSIIHSFILPPPISLSPCLSNAVCSVSQPLTCHAWISFPLSKHTVIHNTASLGRGK